MALTINDVLKLSLAGAILSAGLAPGYYYMIYLPHKDEVADRVQEERRETEKRRKNEDQERKDKEATSRRESYRLCVASAMSDYSSNWNLNCENQSRFAQQRFKACTESGYSNVEACRQTFPAVPAAGCSLSMSLANQLQQHLDSDKETCRKEAESGLSS